MSLNHLVFTEGLPAAQAPLLAWHPQVEPGWGLRAQGPQKEHPQVQAGLSVQAWAPLRIEGGEAWGPETANKILLEKAKVETMERKPRPQGLRTTQRFFIIIIGV